MTHPTRTTHTILLLTVLLAACAAPAASTPISGSPAAVATQAPADTGGEAGGVEASSLVTYSDAAQGFAIGHPATWTQDPAVKTGVRFAGGDDSMTLAFASPPAGADAMAYARGDAAALSALFPGFQQIGLAASTEVSGAIVLGFQASGTSAVTGKAFAAHDERYYLPLADGRLATLTFIGPAAHYDREGFRDVALTFKATR